MARFQPNPIKDVTGEKYNRLTITGLAPFRISQGGNRYKRVYTICECGNTGESSYKDLTRGKVKSCGCIIEDKKLNIVPGEQYGLWTVIREVKPYISKKNGKEERRVMVRCSCGKERVRFASSILNNKSNSCGCRGTIKKEKIIHPDPTDTKDEKWVKMFNSDIQWVSNKGRRYIKKTGTYYNIKKGSGFNDSKKGYLWWGRIIYKSFYGEWDTKKYKLGFLDASHNRGSSNDIISLNLDNIYIAERTSTVGKPDWITYLRNNTKNSNQEGEVTKKQIFEVYKKQKGKSYYLNLDMDLTCTNDLLAISVDRVDNTKGYSDDNIVLCTRFENKGRSNNSIEDMMQLVNLITRGV